MQAARAPPTGRSQDASPIHLVTRSTHVVPGAQQVLSKGSSVAGRMIPMKFLKCSRATNSQDPWQEDRCGDPRKGLSSGWHSRGQSSDSSIPPNRQRAGEVTPLPCLSLQMVSLSLQMVRARLCEPAVLSEAQQLRLGAAVGDRAPGSGMGGGVWGVGLRPRPSG